MVYTSSVTPIQMSLCKREYRYGVGAADLMFSSFLMPRRCTGSLAQCRKTLQKQLVALRESEKLREPPDRCAVISILFKALESQHPYL